MKNKKIMTLTVLSTFIWQTGIIPAHALSLKGSTQLNGNVIINSPVQIDADDTAKAGALTGATVILQPSTTGTIDLGGVTTGALVIGNNAVDAVQGFVAPVNGIQSSTGVTSVPAFITTSGLVSTPAITGLSPVTSPTLAADMTDAKIGKVIELTFLSNSDWEGKVTSITIDGVEATAGNYSVTAGKIAIDSSLFPSAKTYSIVVKATGYRNAVVSQPIASADPILNDPPGLDADSIDAKVGEDIEVTFPTNVDWQGKITVVEVDGTAVSADKYSVDSGKIKLDKILFPTAKSYEIVVKATGYKPATVTQVIEEAAPLLLNAPVLSPDTTDTTVGQNIEITFSANADWEGKITAVEVDGTEVTNDKYTVESGKITLDESLFSTAKSYELVVKATGYNPATVSQVIADSNPGLLTPPALSADTTDTIVGKDVEIIFPANTDWEGKIATVEVDGTAVDSGKFTVGTGKITLDPRSFPFGKDYTIVVKASGYTDAQVTQNLTQPQTLFFSEYLSAGPGQRALEVYNPYPTLLQGSTGYEVEVYQWVDTTSKMKVFTIPLEYLPANSVNITIDSIFYDYMDVTNAWYYNNEAPLTGDGIHNCAFVLKKDGQICDVLGDPSGSTFLLDNGGTIVRKQGISGGTESYIPDQWNQYPKGTFNFMGSHTP